jgi:ribosomal protein S18 acetylase RimI-like enzyme
MTEHIKILVRNAREQDIPAVAEIDAEVFSPDEADASPQKFQERLTAFPNGFIILVAGNEIAGYGCSEKWLDEHEPQPGQPPLAAHKPDGRIFFIAALAVQKKYRGRGYRSILLDKLIETAHLEGCRKVLLEAAQDEDLYMERGFKTIRNRIEGRRTLDVMSLDLAYINRTP